MKSTVHTVPRCSTSKNFCIATRYALPASLFRCMLSLYSLGELNYMRNGTPFVSDTVMTAEPSSMPLGRLLQLLELRIMQIVPSSYCCSSRSCSRYACSIPSPTSRGSIDAESIRDKPVNDRAIDDHVYERSRIYEPLFVPWDRALDSSPFRDTACNCRPASKGN